MGDLITRIHNIAVENCKEYPNIEFASSIEKLWAIETTLQGLDSACDDLHEVIRELMKRYDIPFEEITKITEKIWRRSHENTLHDI